MDMMCRMLRFSLLIPLLCLAGAVRAGEVQPELLATIADDKAGMEDRDAAVKSLAATHEGGLALINLAKADKLADELKSSAALACAGSEFEDVRTAAAKSLPTPKSKEGTPLPAIKKLVEMKGDAARGKAVFANAKGANCVSCHQLGELGRQVGPPLDTIGEKPKDVLYETILTPSAAIQHGFETWLVKTKAGKVFTGIIVDDNDEKLTLRDVQGEYQEIPTPEVAKKIHQNQSLMPEGLVATMTVQDLVDLVEFLSKQKVQ
jgi:putative heme-binding domain-containing protein